MPKREKKDVKMKRWGKRENEEEMLHEKEGGEKDVSLKDGFGS